MISNTVNGITSTIDNNINLNRSITANINNQNVIIVQCNANIRINESLSYYIKIFERTVFNENIEAIQEQINAWKLEVEEASIQNNVPVV